MTITYEDILQARDSISGQVVRTPLVPVPALNAIYGLDLWLKLETFQATGSFKDRGALNKLLSLTDKQRDKGVVAMSAGNHAQGVAYHAGRLGIPAVIIMPETAPFVKVERTRGFGAEIILQGRTLDECKPLVQQLMEERGLTLVHPYDDDLIISGQGTIGLEIAEDLPDVERVVVPIGGGGIISGIATALSHTHPDVDMVGVEAEFYPSMAATLSKRPSYMHGATLADGIAVKQPGEITRNIVTALVDTLVTVTEQQLELAVTELVETCNVVAEGAGAAGVAALIANPEAYRGKRTVAVVCGGNIDAHLLSNVLKRGLLASKRMIRLRVTIDDQPGVLSKVGEIVGAKRGNIVDVTHRRSFSEIPAKNAYLDLTIEVPSPAAETVLVQALTAGGFPARALAF